MPHKDSLLFRDSKDIKCYLDLTGDIDKIKCICGMYKEIEFYLPKLKKKNLVLAFVKEHRKCKEKK